MPKTTLTVNIDLAPVLAASIDHFTNERPIDFDEATLLDALHNVLDIEVDELIAEWEWRLKHEHQLVSKIEQYIRRKN